MSTPSNSEHHHIQNSEVISVGDCFKDRYKVVKILGEGGQGKVFLVKDIQHNVE
jgi:serine/threonine protein kinase